MKDKVFVLAWMSLIFASCDHRKAPRLAPEYLFTPKNQKVISSIINNKNGTIAIVFGNASAVQASTGTRNIHSPGEYYTMVTWKQKPMPHWYGTNMNGEIYAIETVEISQGINGDNLFRYHLQTSSGHPTVDQNEKRRISLITNRRAAVFP